MKIHTLITLLCVLTSLSAFAEIVSIPLEYTSYPAKDLIGKDGDVLDSNELRRIWETKKDLSQLDPQESDIWKNNVGQTLSKALDDFEVSNDEEFKYVDKVISTVGSFRFLVREEISSRKRNFNIWLSKDNRSILLRKNLLRKLGYIVPKVQHKQEIKIKFKGKASLNAFVTDIENGTFADSKRWIKKIDEDNDTVYMQDVLIMEGNTRIYNLAMGELGDDTIKHRRALNALSIPFALVDVRESIDGFTWSAGSLDNKVVIFDIISGDKFTTTYYDALWMLKRIAKLSKKDIKEIVDYTFLPQSVSLLLTEKLSARVNSVQKLFNKNVTKLHDVDFEISDESGELKKGRLTQDNWDGHAARYSFDDTESPLSKDEMMAYFKSKFHSAVIENLVTYLNENFLYETDVQEEAIARAIDAQQKQFENLFKTGKLEEVPFSTWAMPTAKGHIRASRDIVTGAYLGTDNAIQVADTLEFIGEAGVFVGTLGLPVEVQAFASGNARFSRGYTHVKSIKSIKKALKEPFRNIIVPYVKRKKAKSIIGMIDDLKSEEFQNLEGEERTAALEKVFKELDKVMEIGDSLIISNNLIFGANLVTGYRAAFNTSEVEAGVNFNARKVNLWRFHITRSGEKEFQFYKSKANAIGMGAGVTTKLYMPIISLNLDSQKGDIDTKFQSLSFSNTDDNETTINKFVQLRQVIVENSAELLDKHNPPFVIKHKFKESSKSSKILAYQSVENKLSDKIKIVHPEGFETEFHVNTHSVMAGKNYMQLAYDVLNGILEEYLEDENVSFSNSGSGNPGDSFYGQSFARQTFVEVPYIVEGSEVPFENYAQVKKRWKGWSADRQRLSEIKNSIDKMYGDDLFNDELFYDTDEIKLYSVDVTLSIYAQGIRNLLNIKRRDFNKIIDKQLSIPWHPKRPKYIRQANGNRYPIYRRKKAKVVNAIKLAHKRLNSEYRNFVRPELAAQDINTLIHVLEMMLPFDTFAQMLGGDDHFYLKGSINGFRVGVENGEQSIVSNAIGEFGSEFTSGILDTLRGAIKISQGELGAYWFLRRVL